MGAWWFVYWHIHVETDFSQYKILNSDLIRRWRDSAGKHGANFYQAYTGLDTIRKLEPFNGLWTSAYI